MIEEKIKNKSGYQTIEDEFEYDFEEKKNGNSNTNLNTIKIKNSKKLEKISLVLKNSAYHIYKLQLIQLAESIKRIYKNSKTNEYLITFDNTDEDIPSIILDEKDYKNLISIRDKYTNNDILSSFISKEDCINPNSINKQKKYKILTPVKTKKNNNNNIILINQNKSKDDSYLDDIINNKFYSPSSKGNLYYLSSYNICHQCKLQKIDEDLIKCQYIYSPPQNTNQNNKISQNNSHKNKNNQPSIPQNENPINYFFIGQSAIILTNKIYYLKNYDDSVKELVDNYFVNKLKETNKKCQKCYCKNCLRTVYDIDINEIRKKNFRCPSCFNRCNCSRCIRNENLIKQIAYFLNNHGDMDKLYNYLIKRNSIFEKLKDYLVMSKFICIDFNTKNYTPLKLNIPSSKVPNNSGEKENNELNPLELLKYKKNLETMQIDFCNIYDQTNSKMQVNESEIFKIKEIIKEAKNKNEKKLVGHKIKKSSNKKKNEKRK